MILTNKIDLENIVDVLPEETTFLEIPQILGIDLKVFLSYYGLDCVEYSIKHGGWYGNINPTKHKAVVIYNDKGQRVYHENSGGVIEYYQYSGFKLTGMLKKVTIKELLNVYGKYRCND